MKVFGQILAGIVVMVLAGLAIFGIATVTTNNTTNNKTTNTTLTIQEARELVDHALAACSRDSGNSSNLSTAAIEDYEYDYVRPIDAGGTSYLQVLFMAKYPLETYETTAGAYRAVADPDYHLIGDTWEFVYELKENGIVLDYLVYKDGQLLPNKTVLELYYADKSKAEWKMIVTMADINNEVENYTHQDSNTPGQFVVVGAGNKMKKFEWYQIELNKSLYGETLTQDNVISVVSERIDSTVNEKEWKVFGDLGYSPSDSAGTMTDEEINVLLENVQNDIKNVYSPKFYGIEFKESNYWEAFAEYMENLESLSDYYLADQE